MIDGLVHLFLPLAWKGLGMAGKRQHYIPRFLQRGFLASGNATGSGERTWLHLRGDTPRLTGIRDVGVETHFYSRPSLDGSRTLDDLITDIESVFLGDLRYACEAAIEQPLDSDRAARLVTHLMLRTAFVRSTFNQAALGVVDEIVALVGTRESARAGFRIDDPTLDLASSPLVTAAVEAATEAGVDMPLPLKQRVMGYVVREHFDDIFSGMDATMAVFRKLMTERMAKTSAEAHNKVLALEKQTAWEVGLGGLVWQIQSVRQVILPDCIAVAQIDGGDLSPLVMAGLDGLEVCIVPIRADRVMVGRRVGAALPCLDALNRSLAACADRFFIATTPMGVFGLSERIGQRAAEVMGSTVADAIAHLRPATSGQPSADAQARIAQAKRASAAFSYSLTIPPLESQVQVEVVQTLVQAAVYEQSLHMPLEALDGITFALDYASTVARFDRGDDALPPDPSQERDYGTPVAKCLTVTRDGQRKLHLVFDAKVALMLASPDKTEMQGGIHILASQLGHVVHDAAYQWPFEARGEHYPDATTALLYPAAATLPGQYFTARAAAYAAPSAGARYAELFRDAMASARQIIDSARLRYRVDANLDAFVAIALRAANHAMDHAAQWLGHREGLGGDSEDGGLMAETAASLGLYEWLTLLGDDLRQLYDPEEDFSTARVFALTRHVERVFWIFQMFPWLTEDGRAYVTVPMGNDAAILDAAEQVTDG
ncbi:hypothetical protein [Stenotrophomonas forensis]|nr:hypothetical protein [Stenotrophomonas maltophilia]HEL3777972.1 hypothetical protein [Stenotrophomonas maltophilia]HEL5005768.1 hypothetical protein [Stenotrophomonas maltophilia]